MDDPAIVSHRADNPRTVGRAIATGVVRNGAIEWESHRFAPDSLLLAPTLASFGDPGNPDWRSCGIWVRCRDAQNNRIGCCFIPWCGIGQALPGAGIRAGYGSGHGGWAIVFNRLDRAPDGTTILLNWWQAT